MIKLAGLLKVLHISSNVPYNVNFKAVCNPRTMSKPPASEYIFTFL